MFVKICGVTNEEDARLAVESGADAVGFVFWAGSTRVADPAAVAAFAARLPDDIITVAVFRDERPERVLDVIRATGVRAAQVHGAIGADIAALRREIPFVIEAIHAGTGLGDRVAASPADLILVDAAQPGSGRTFDWSLMEHLPTERMLLAGGLTPMNVAEAIRRVRPFGVDVASGVEASPGRKDPHKVRRFVEAARREGARVGRPAGDVGS
jgi:phosphoribosylanthranilate isomerase